MVAPTSSVAHDNVSRSTKVLRRPDSNTDAHCDQIAAGSRAAFFWIRFCPGLGAHGSVVAERYRSWSSGPISALRAFNTMAAAISLSRTHERISAGPLVAFCPAMNHRAANPQSTTLACRNTFKANVVPTATSRARSGALLFKVSRACEDTKLTVGSPVRSSSTPSIVRLWVDAKFKILLARLLTAPRTSCKSRTWVSKIPKSP